jgi:hypothetical protein
MTMGHAMSPGYGDVITSRIHSQQHSGKIGSALDPNTTAQGPDDGDSNAAGRLPARPCRAGDREP